MVMTYGSVCSGIEAAGAAWTPLGWECAFVAEIDPFASTVLQHRFGASRPIVMPEPTIHTKHKDRKAMLAAIRAVLGLDERGVIPNYGDFTRIGSDAGPIDLLVGGTPCQSFSVAGLRGGMADDRGNLALEFLRLAGRLRPRWVVWENVPGVLSSSGGRDFGAFLGGLAELGYGFAYRVLDAQYVRVDGFGRAVPQRRRRVFVVGCLGDWRRAAAVLFDRESLSRDTPPGREAGEIATGCLTGGAHSSSAGNPDDNRAQGGFVVPMKAVAGTLNAVYAKQSHNGMVEMENGIVAHSLRADGFDASEDGTGRGTPLIPVVAPSLFASNGGVSSGYHPVVPVAFNWQAGGKQTTVGFNPQAGTTGAIHVGQTPAIAFQERGREGGRTLEWQEDVSYALRAIDGGGCGDWFRVAWNWAVRRLTPLECERLQGFPDGWTLVPYRGKTAADGPRYKAVGNSMAVNCMRWIGRRIELVDNLLPELAA